MLYCSTIYAHVYDYTGHSIVYNGDCISEPVLTIENFCVVFYVVKSWLLHALWTEDVASSCMRCKYALIY